METRMERNKDLHRKVNEANAEHNRLINDPQHKENKSALEIIDPIFFNGKQEKTTNNKNNKKYFLMVIGIVLALLAILLPIILI